jgi:hypothetical protein
MSRQVSIPVVVVVWLLVGVVVAISQDYGRQLDNASQAATFLLAVLLWPIPATGGDVAISF